MIFKMRILIVKKFFLGKFSKKIAFFEKKDDLEEKKMKNWDFFEILRENSGKFSWKILLKGFQ